MNNINKKKKTDKKSLTDEVIDSYRDPESAKYDPNGSWTGVPADIYEKPIQDADDLQ